MLIDAVSPRQRPNTRKRRLPPIVGSRVFLVFVVAIGLLTAGCRQDMHDQPKYEPQEESTFFADGLASRAPVPGTVARGQLYDDALLYTGREGDQAAQVFPFRVDAQVMERGRERYDIFCAPCHGRTGDGNGMVVQRGFQRPPALSEERLRRAPVGHLFSVVTDGFGTMPDHAAQIPPRDRWAIAAYVRALQLSATATVADVPAAERGRLER